MRTSSFSDGNFSHWTLNFFSSSVPKHDVATTSSCDNFGHRCCKHPDYIDTCPPVRTEIDAICGLRNELGASNNQPEQDLEVDEANFGEWPHVCAVLRKTYFDGEASIIDFVVDHWKFLLGIVSI